MIIRSGGPLWTLHPALLAHDGPRKEQPQAIVLLVKLVRLGVIRFETFRETSPLILLLLLSIGLYIPISWGTTQGPAW
jgi:hypothetical protein